jgi:hypothetical protein
MEIRMAETALQVNNINVASLYRRMNRMIGELWRSSASNVEWVRAPDLKRLKDYLTVYEAEVKFAASISDNYDFPETKDYKETLEAPEEHAEVENEYVNLILSFMNRWRMETAYCQSKGQQMGLKPPDTKRELYNITELRRLLTELVEPTQPGDYPATSPQEADGGPPRN